MQCKLRSAEPISDLTLTLHGLDEFNRLVDAEVFARKFSAFMRGLAIADQEANGVRKHKYLLSDLRRNTASAQVREQRISYDAAATASGAAYYQHAIDVITSQNEERRVLPEAFIKQAVILGRDVGRSFAYAEIKSNETVVAILDDRFFALASEALEIRANDNATEAQRFRGVAFGSFDGILEMVDIRAGGRKAILTLTAGGLDIDCDVKALNFEEVRSGLGKRTTVYGMARYDGKSALPVHLDVRTLTVLQGDANLMRWRAAFDFPDELDSEEDWP